MRLPAIGDIDNAIGAIEKATAPTNGVLGKHDTREQIGKRRLSGLMGLLSNVDAGDKDSQRTTAPRQADWEVRRFAC